MLGYGHSYRDDLLYQFYGMENVTVLTIARDRQHATRTKRQQKTSRLEKLRPVFHDHGRRLFPAKNFLFADLDDVLASDVVLTLLWYYYDSFLRF